MRALYEIVHAEPAAPAFETSIAVTGLASNWRDRSSSALSASPVTAIDLAITYRGAAGSVCSMRHVRSSSANLYNSDHSSDCV